MSHVSRRQSNCWWSNEITSLRAACFRVRKLYQMLRKKNRQRQPTRRIQETAESLKRSKESCSKHQCDCGGETMAKLKDYTLESPVTEGELREKYGGISDNAVNLAVNTGPILPTSSRRAQKKEYFLRSGKSKCRYCFLNPTGHLKIQR